MPKIYYRCSNCHKIKLLEYCCTNCGKMGAYACQRNYWWELLYMKIKTYIRIFVNTLKIIRDSWRVFLQYERHYVKIEKMLKEWSKK